jgi:hypothetical protein
MPFNGSGTYAAPASSWNPAVANTDIDVTDWTALLADVTTALSTCVLKDGTQTATAVIPFGSGISLSGGTTLANYVQGSWTPVIAFGGASVGVTYGVQVGRYTRIGNIVMFTCRITLTAKGSSTGSVTITGLPVTSANVSGLLHKLSVGFTSVNLDVGGGYYSPLAEVNVNSTTIAVYEQGDNVAAAAITDADLVDTSTIDITGHYQV